MLSDAGRRQLGHAERDGRCLHLPESPQHRVWREARGGAKEHVNEVSQEVRERLADAGALLERELRESDP